jgi:hypothetical protein
MGWNPLSGLQNIFGGGSSFANQGYDSGTDESGWDTNPMRRVFGSGSDNGPWIDDSGFNRSKMKEALGGAFSNYDVQSPYELNRRDSELDKFKPGPALQRYIDYSDEMPNRADYQPGKWGSFIAALAGGAEGYKNPSAGVKTALAMREEPYRRASTDYESKLKAMHDAAQLESQAENYEALSGYRNYGAMTGRGRLDETIRNNQERNAMNRSWNLSKIDMFGKNLEEKKREFGITSSETGRHNIEGEKTDRTRAGAAVTSAGAAVTNAATNQAREKAYETDVTSKVEDRKNKPKAGAKGPSASEFNTADAQAATEVARENAGRWGNFVDKYGHTVPPTGWLGGRTSNPEFAAFLIAQKKRRDEIINQSHPNWVISGSSTPAPDGVKQVDY